MWASLVIPVYPRFDPSPRLLKAAKELVLPHPLLFETAKEAFYQTIVLRRVRRKLLIEAIVATSLAKPAALKS